MMKKSVKVPKPPSPRLIFTVAGAILSAKTGSPHPCSPGSGTVHTTHATKNARYDTATKMIPVHIMTLLYNEGEKMRWKKKQKDNLISAAAQQ